jgi:hypothetical protein
MISAINRAFRDYISASHHEQSYRLDISEILQRRIIDISDTTLSHHELVFACERAELRRMIFSMIYWTSTICVRWHPSIPSILLASWYTRNRLSHTGGIANFALTHNIRSRSLMLGKFLLGPTGGGVRGKSLVCSLDPLCPLNLCSRKCTLSAFCRVLLRQSFFLLCTHVDVVNAHISLFQLSFGCRFSNLLCTHVDVVNAHISLFSLFCRVLHSAIALLLLY